MGETKIRNQTDIFFLEHSELNKREWSSKLVGRKGRGGEGGGGGDKGRGGGGK